MIKVIACLYLACWCLDGERAEIPFLFPMYLVRNAARLCWSRQVIHRGENLKGSLFTVWNARLLDLQVFSFKLRGAYNMMAKLSPEQRKRGVITSSAGNHAQGVALAAKRLGCLGHHCNACHDARHQVA